MITAAAADSNMEQSTSTAAEPAAAAEGAPEEAAPPEVAATATRLVPASGVDKPAYNQIVSLPSSRFYLNAVDSNSIRIPVYQVISLKIVSCYCI
jgi:hypothetical protein